MSASRRSALYAASAAAPASFFLAWKFHLLGAAPAPWVMFLAAAAWGLLLLQSFTGWGWIVTRGLLRLRASEYLHAAAGLALAIALGGWLNLYGWVNAWSLGLFVWTGAISYAGGVLFASRTPVRDPGPTPGLSRRVVLLTGFLVVALVWSYITAAGWPKFNPHDDYHAYLAFTEKLVQLGSLGEDPFSRRRLISGLGGQYFLLSLVAAEFPLRFLHILDPGVAVLMLAGMVTAAIPAADVRVKLTLLGLAAAVAMFPFPIVNVSTVVIVIPLLLAMWLLLADCQRVLEADPSASLLSRAILIGLCGASACTLKNSFIPYVALAVFAGGCSLLVNTPALWKRLLGWAVPAIGVAAATLGPWMADLQRSSGTALYPLFGKGYEGSVYGTSPPLNAGFLQAETLGADLGNWLVDPFLRLPMLITLVLLVHTLWRHKLRDPATLLPASMFMTALISLLIMGFATGAYNVYRYTVPFVFGSLLAGLIIVARRPTAGQWPVAPLVSAALLAVFGLVSLLGEAGKAAAAVSRSVQGQELVTAERREAYADLSAHLPVDGAVLTRLQFPFLLRFRPDVYIADVPGGASPPPGMPVGTDPAELRRYLLGEGVRYVAWDYATEAGFSREKYGKRLEPGAFRVERSEAQQSFDFQTALEALRVTRPLVYDRHGIVIIVLAGKPLNRSTTGTR